MFNEVFFNDVFVPDDAVVGAPGDGWRIGRTTLANERVSMSTGASFGPGVESLTRTLARRSERGEPGPPSMEERLGHLIAEAQTVALLGHRSTLRTLSGVDPGSGSSVRKLLGVEHEQRVQEMGMALYGANGAVLDGKAQRWEEGFLSTRCLTIAGGTSEVQRNVIAERILGPAPRPRAGFLSRRHAGTHDHAMSSGPEPDEDARRQRRGRRVAVPLGALPRRVGARASCRPRTRGWPPSTRCGRPTARPTS